MNKFSGLCVKKGQNVGSIEISPIQTERKLKYYNYNLSDKLKQSYKKLDMHPIDNSMLEKGEEKTDIRFLRPLTESDLGIIEVTPQKEYFFATNASIEPVRKLSISDPLVFVSIE